jgi:hypothetical protein
MSYVVIKLIGGNKTLSNILSVRRQTVQFSCCHFHMQHTLKYHVSYKVLLEAKVNEIFTVIWSVKWLNIS